MGGPPSAEGDRRSARRRARTGRDRERHGPLRRLSGGERRHTLVLPGDFTDGRTRTCRVELVDERTEPCLGRGPRGSDQLPGPSLLGRREDYIRGARTRVRQGSPPSVTPRSSRRSMGSARRRSSASFRAGSACHPHRRLADRRARVEPTGTLKAEPAFHWYDQAILIATDPLGTLNSALSGCWGSSRRSCSAPSPPPLLNRAHGVGRAARGARSTGFSVTINVSGSSPHCS